MGNKVGVGKPRTLILGGSGFIGQHFTAQLLEAGRYVVSYDRLLPYRFTEGVKAYEVGDIAETAKIAEIINRHRITHVVHLVSTTLPSTSNSDVEFDIVSNLIGTIKILDLCVAQRIDKILFMSSGGTVYGVTSGDPVRESHDTNPICSYGIIKLAIEKYLQLYGRLYGLRYSIIRAANPFGPGQYQKQGQGIIAAFVEQMMHNLPLTVWGDGSTVRDFIDVRDLVRLCVLALDSNESDTYNAGSGVGVSIQQLINQLASCMDRAATVDYESSRVVDVPAIVLDCAKAKMALAWSPKISLVDSMKDYIKWYKSVKKTSF